ncbi:hypothetical protein A0H81_08095 [Grifola frondosa]|uniref:Uncharacterized protein n=1 Tax=Grifola frondosa TaxID=5627 RepID=A0A1C7M503_GRIFR|nr:hypothetical protein A0H81_08095 [Grifola frondosa]
MGAIDIRFPSLMRLHIVEDDPEYYEIAWQECANAAPSVTHLRMSNLNSELLSRDTFGVVAGVNSEAYCQGQSGRLRIPIESYASLRQLNTASQKARIVRRRGRHMGESWVWRLKKEWEDRMCGGVGCWIETETEEIEWQRRLALEEAINGPLKAYANHKADV